MVNGKKHLAALLLVIAAAPMLAGLDQSPFEDGLRGSCGAFFSLMAQNHLRYGLAATGGIPIVNPAEADRSHFAYYRHHPPLIPLLLAAVYELTGESEVAARGLALTFHLIALSLLAVLIWPKCGWLTLPILGAAALTPYSTYFGPFLNFEVPCLAMLVLTAALVALGDRRSLALGLVTLGLGGLLDWPIFLAAPLLAWRSWPRSRALAAGYLAVPLAVVALVTVWQLAQVQRGGFFPEAGSFTEYLHQVSPLADDPQATLLGRVGLAGWARRQLEFAWQLGSLPVVLAALALPLLVRRTDAPDEPIAWLARTFLWVAALNLFLFAGRSVDHDYYGLYLLPWIVTGTALLASRLRARFGRAGTAAIAALLVIAAGFAAASSWQRYAARRWDGLATAHRIRDVTRAGDTVFVPAGTYDLQVPYYARRGVFALPESESGVAALRKLFGLEHRPALVLVPQNLPRPEWMSRLPGDPPQWQERDGFAVWVIDRGKEP